jgi:N-acetylglucosaminyldiphosphoundecaprenol N-acetyl-beta-D-mannosaminyltransferase
MIRSGENARPPIAILGVPFDNVTRAEAIQRIEAMITSRKPHYLVTPNVDFLVQARRDIELRRILFEAHLVLCDGTPLVWASRLLGNALPERVAGADLVPSLIQVAAQKKYRLFLLGASVDSAEQAVTRLEERYPGIVIAGHYSPPFNQLLEMDHQAIRNRILAAEPDLLFVSFGCPKQEKWVAMHYRSLGVPVTAGVGATIDFLAGKVVRAPVWMQRSGTEWMFRLAQEPRRLFRRYLTDLWSFSLGIVPQWWELQARPCLKRQRTKTKAMVPAVGGAKVE